MNRAYVDRNARRFVCYRQRDTCNIYYVAEVPGNGGKDWGYTSDPTKAARLSDYWRGRFKADCSRVGQHGLCYEVSHDNSALVSVRAEAV